jgi:hypothetical protein
MRKESAMTQHATASARQAPPLCDEQGPIPTFPPIPTDPVTGRPLPISEEERAARRDAAIRVLKAIARRPGQDPPGTLERMLRGIDEDRPPGQKIFEGMY